MFLVDGNGCHVPVVWISQRDVYLTSRFNRFTNSTRRGIAAQDVGDVDIVGRVNDKRAVLYLAADAEEGQEADSRLDDDLIFILQKKKMMVDLNCESARLLK